MAAGAVCDSGRGRGRGGRRRRGVALRHRHDARRAGASGAVGPDGGRPGQACAGAVGAMPHYRGSCGIQSRRRQQVQRCRPNVAARDAGARFGRVARPPLGGVGWNLAPGYVGYIRAQDPSTPHQAGRFPQRRARDRSGQRCGTKGRPTPGHTPPTSPDRHVDQGHSHRSRAKARGKRSKRVRSPLIGASGVATRRHGLAWGRTYAEERSNHVHSALIGGSGVATRRHGLAWGRTYAEERSNHVHSALIGGSGVATRRHGLAWGWTYAEERSNHVHSALIGGGARRARRHAGTGGRRRGRGWARAGLPSWHARPGVLDRRAAGD
jgi:hypothetical protein